MLLSLLSLKQNQNLVRVWIFSTLLKNVNFFFNVSYEMEKTTYIPNVVIVKVDKKIK
jgi:hypothetical protein